MTCPETIAIGAYVLGALDVEERRATERHLVTCDSCREALLQFAHLPGLLHAVPLEDIEVDEPAPALQLPARRTPRRRTLLAAAAVVIAAVVGIFGWQSMADPQHVTWTATDGIDVTARLTSHPWGTDIKLQMAELPPAEHCKLIVHSRDGTTEIAGWWATTATYQADVPASTSIPLDAIDRLEVVTSGNTVISTVTATTR